MSQPKLKILLPGPILREKMRDTNTQPLVLIVIAVVVAIVIASVVITIVEFGEGS